MLLKEVEAAGSASSEDNLVYGDWFMVYRHKSG